MSSPKAADLGENKKEVVYFDFLLAFLAVCNHKIIRLCHLSLTSLSNPCSCVDIAAFPDEM